MLSIFITLSLLECAPGSVQQSFRISDAVGWGMRRATTTIPDDLERAIEKYRRDLQVSPTLAAVVQTALREYLAEQGYLANTRQL